MKYVVALFNKMEETNSIYMIEAETEVEAAKKAIINNCPKKYRDKTYIDWAESIGDTIEEVSEGAYQSEFVLSDIFQLETLNDLSKIPRS